MSWTASLKLRTLALAIVALTGAGWIAVSAAPEGIAGGGPPPSPAVGFSAPDFSLPDAEGTEWALSSFRGRVVVLNFWASWCPPCRAEMPAFERLQKAHAKEALVVLAVNAANQDSRSEALAFADNLGLSMALLFDEEGVAQERYRIRALPSTFFIDQYGVIRQVVVGGPLAEAVIKSIALDLLGEVE